MKGFKSILKIMAEDSSEFSDSKDAEKFLEKLELMINDKRLVNWCWSVDNENETSNTVDKLKALSKQYKDLQDMIFSFNDDDAESSDLSDDEISSDEEELDDEPKNN